MFMVSRRLGCASAVVVAVLGLGAPVSHAQSVPYWTTSAWTTGLGLTSSTNANAFGNFSSRYNFDNGWFVGSERGNLGYGLSNFSQAGAFGNPSFTYEGMQTGYNFTSAPVSIYAGFDTVKYNAPPIIGSPFAALDSTSQHRARLWRACGRRNPPHLKSQRLIRSELLATALRPQLRAAARRFAVGVRPPLKAGFSRPKRRFGSRN